MKARTTLDLTLCFRFRFSLIHLYHALLTELPTAIVHHEVITIQCYRLRIVATTERRDCFSRQHVRLKQKRFAHQLCIVRPYIVDVSVPVPFLVLQGRSIIKLTIQQQTPYIPVSVRMRLIFSLLYCTPRVLSSSHGCQNFDFAGSLQLQDDCRGLQVVVALQKTGRDERRYAGDDTGRKCSCGAVLDVFVIAEDWEDKILFKTSAVGSVRLARPRVRLRLLTSFESSR